MCRVDFGDAPPEALLHLGLSNCFLPNPPRDEDRAPDTAAPNPLAHAYKTSEMVHFCICIPPWYRSPLKKAHRWHSLAYDPQSIPVTWPYPNHSVSMLTSRTEEGTSSALAGTRAVMDMDTHLFNACTWPFRLAILANSTGIAPYQSIISNETLVSQIKRSGGGSFFQEPELFMVFYYYAEF